jgi:phage antirepressor YoqD-like protein
LPSIRKHGAFITDELLKLLREDEGYVDELIDSLINEKAKNSALLGSVEELTPKAKYCDVVLLCSDAIQTSIIAKDYGMSAVSFNKLLHSLGIQYKIGGTWLLYQEHADQGYTVSRTYYEDYNGSKIHTCWTQKGRRFLYDLLQWYGILPVAERFPSMAGERP